MLDHGRVAARNAGRLHLLIVEDHETTARVFKRLLEMHGRFVVRTAASYREALSVAAEWVPDVLVCDLALAGEKDGIDVFTAMRGAHPKVHGVVVTGSAAPDDLERAREAGFARILCKPVIPERLITAIEDLFVDADAGSSPQPGASQSELDPGSAPA